MCRGFTAPATALYRLAVSSLQWNAIADKEEK
jgi:hypothetical protein